MTTTAKATKWTVDPQHSTVQFKVKHLGIANVTGVFNVFNGSVTGDGDGFEAADIGFTADAASIDTRNSERDNHLRSPQFFDVLQFPSISFRGALVKSNGDHVITGELTIRGITRTITLQAEATGAGPGRFGDHRAGFEADGRISRKDFGLDFQLLTGAGNLVVGEEVRLHFDLELIRAAS
jgi:polyisoprenoid-binding protein YceI